MKLKNIKSLKTLLVLIIIVEIVFEAGYFGYHYYKKRETINMLNDEIVRVNLDIKNLRSKQDKVGISPSIVHVYKKMFENKRYTFGAGTGELKFIGKASKPGTDQSLLKAQLTYSAEDMRALKLLIATLYFNSYLVKITNIDMGTRTITLYLDGNPKGREFSAGNIAKEVKKVIIKGVENNGK